MFRLLAAVYLKYGILHLLTIFFFCVSIRYLSLQLRFHHGDGTTLHVDIDIVCHDDDSCNGDSGGTVYDALLLLLKLCFNATITCSQ